MFTGSGEFKSQLAHCTFTVRCQVAYSAGFTWFLLFKNVRICAYCGGELVEWQVDSVGSLNVANLATNTECNICNTE